MSRQPTPRLHQNMVAEMEDKAMVTDDFDLAALNIWQKLGFANDRLNQVPVLANELRKLSAALAQAGQPVAVKPLEWTAEDNGDFIAVSAVGWYHVGLPASYWSVTTPSGEILSGFETHTEAQAAAQADYERRILSALAYPPAKREAGETAPPQSHVMPTPSPWQWWAGSSEEWCTVGPEDTREAIIQAATNDSLGEFEHEGGGWNLGFYIVEARQDPLRLADWIESDRLLERAEDSVADSDRTSSEYDDGPWFKCTPEQEKDLEERVKRACDEWQAAHKLTFSCPTFSHTRHQEHVIVELPDDRATTEGSDNA